MLVECVEIYSKDRRSIFKEHDLIEMCCCTHSCWFLFILQPLQKEPQTWLCGVNNSIRSSTKIFHKSLLELNLSLLWIKFLTSNLIWWIRWSLESFSSSSSLKIRKTVGQPLHTAKALNVCSDQSKTCPDYFFIFFSSRNWKLTDPLGQPWQTRL